MMQRAFVVVLMTILSLASADAKQRPGAPAQRPSTETLPPRDEPGGQPSTSPREVATAAEEKISQTAHAVRLDGRDIKYTATAGTLPIRLDAGRIVARMFFVAYTKDG